MHDRIAAIRTLAVVVILVALLPLYLVQWYRVSVIDRLSWSVESFPAGLLGSTNRAADLPALYREAQARERANPEIKNLVITTTRIDGQPVVVYPPGMDRVPSQYLRAFPLIFGRETRGDIYLKVAIQGRS